MKRSCEVGPGIYQFEFRENHIDLVEWTNEPPTSTTQWVRIEPTTPGVQYYLEGTCNEDIRLVLAEPLFETICSG